MEATIGHLNATMPDLLPGYRVKIIDGNAIAASEHRLEMLRDISRDDDCDSPRRVACFSEHDLIIISLGAKRLLICKFS
ncbi:hypothetical protein [aff. Roholtiella sp. LEGE 12411]|uniref:hypothetical protein n=1 Tax=aff. Roholtiella sp. LEGE 12411 TaxID=1828822 RepID=UPI00188188CA|nr:hypothetical protein [aff. Roholtiella sp. LEGE 12411]MBE9038681.1 hypothetical protein [aff. Roholtiella sp. LEGE 12411]